jgi:hypothetical protein
VTDCAPTAEGPDWRPPNKRSKNSELDRTHEQAEQVAISALRSILTHDLAQAADDARTLLVLIEHEQRIVEREG